MKNFFIFLFHITIWLLPFQSYGQLINLGSASTFAVFTSVGAFSNTGVTNIVGNIGTNVGLYTGSPNVVGSVHIADSLSAVVAVDVASAYGVASALPCDSLIGVTLGNGQILPPHQYCTGAASTLNGDLTLDGQNNSNSVFVIIIDGAFATSSRAKVILINHAVPRNVFWIVNGAVGLGDSSIFNGTIIANGAISMYFGASLTGRALSKAGAIDLYQNEINIGLDSNGLPLPIQLLSFNATVVNAQVYTSWSTASEINNDFFTLQKSGEELVFEDVVRVNGKGNSFSLTKYLAVDAHPSIEKEYYRLKQTDYNGASSYSKIVFVDLDKIKAFNIYPNPFTQGDDINFVQSSGLHPTTVSLSIFNEAGREVYTSVLTKKQQKICTENFAPGTYYYHLTYDNQFIQSGSIISQ